MRIIALCKPLFACSVFAERGRCSAVDMKRGDQCQASESCNIPPFLEPIHHSFVSPFTLLHIYLLTRSLWPLRGPTSSSDAARTTARPARTLGRTRDICLFVETSTIFSWHQIFWHQKTQNSIFSHQTTVIHIFLQKAEHFDTGDKSQVCPDAPRGPTFTWWPFRPPWLRPLRTSGAKAVWPTPSSTITRANTITQDIRERWPRNMLPFSKILGTDLYSHLFQYVGWLIFNSLD